MGGILLQALLKHGLLSPQLTCATVAHEERAKALASKWNVKVGTSNAEAVKGADIILIAVKPQVVQEVVKEISAYVTSKQLIISVAASVPTSLIEKGLDPAGLISHLQSQYDISAEQAAQDAHSFLKDLSDEGLVEPA